MSEESLDSSSVEDVEDDDSVSLFDLLKTLMHPKTLPHVFNLFVSSALLFILLSSQAQAQSILFVSFSLAYVLMGTVFLKQFEQRKQLSSNQSSSFIKRLFIPLLLPLAISGVLTLLLFLTLGEDDGIGELLPSGLASLFVIWSILQGRAVLNWMKISGNEVKYVPPNAPLLIIVFLIVIALLMYLNDVVQGHSTIQFSEYILFLVLVGVCVVAGFYLTKGHRMKMSQSANLRPRYTRTMFIVMLFIVWHLFTVQRQFNEGSQALMFVEEILLMMFTVVMSIWTVTSKSYRSQFRIVTQRNALPLGIAFGFAYAGSIAVLSEIFGDVRNVLIAGHLIVVITMLLGLNSSLTKIQSKQSDVADIQELVSKYTTNSPKTSDDDMSNLQNDGGEETQASLPTNSEPTTHDNQENNEVQAPEPEDDDDEIELLD